MRIAVVGGGVSGITAAHILQRSHAVSLFEANDYLGGHTNTVTIPSGPDAGAAIDTGFIVLNDKNYPLLHRLLAQLGTAVRWSDMSFGYHCESDDFTYAGTTLNGLFAKRSNLLSWRFLRFLREISLFCHSAQLDLTQDRLGQRTVGQYLHDKNFSKELREHYLIPMAAAIWSTSDVDTLEFPIEMLVRFFGNHGLLSLRDRPHWQTVVGGSSAYVKAFQQRFKGEIFLNAAVVSISRNSLQSSAQSLEPTVTLKFVHQEQQIERQFDRVIVATHADQALKLLLDPRPEEFALLSPWRYQANRILLHTDESVLPSNKRAWASWNYRRERQASSSRPVAVTYHMNRLQGLKLTNQYLVTLNPQRQIDSQRIVREIEYSHPVYNEQSLRAIANKRVLPTTETFFCGSYCGYGFHEDGVSSGVEAAKHFGLEL